MSIERLFTGLPNRVRNYVRDYLLVLGEARRQVPAVLGLTVITSILDLVGVGLVGPLVVIISTGNASRYLPSLATQPRLVFLGIGIALVLIYVIKGWLSYVLNRKIVLFSERHRAQLIGRIIGAYQARDWESILEAKGGELANRILWHTNVYSNGTLTASLRLITDTLVIIILSLFLAISDPIAVLILLCLLATLFLVVHAFVRPRLTRAHQIMVDSYRQTNLFAGEAIESLREIRALGHEAYFRRLATDAATLHAHGAAQAVALGQIPRYSIETLMIGVLVAVAGIRFAVEGAASSTLPVLATIAAAGVRLMPAATSWITNLNAMRSSRFILHDLADEVRRLGPQGVEHRWESPNVPARPHSREKFREIEFDKVTFSYRSPRRPVLEDLSFRIRAGECVGVTGPSGSGKSTLADLMLGFLSPQAGHILVNAMSIQKDLRGWHDRVAYIPQAACVLDESIRGNITFGKAESPGHDERLAWAIGLAQLSGVVKDLPAGLDTLVGPRGARLSGGQRQRLALARALFQNREFLILDEATSALDDETERAVMRAIRELRGVCTLVVITHSSGALAECDRVIELGVASPPS